MRVSLIAAIASQLSCAPALRHPAITAGVVGGIVGFGGCEVDGIDTAKCAAIGGGAGLVLGGIAALVLLLSPPDEEPVIDGGEVIDSSDAARFQASRRHHAVDAGVDAPPIAPVAPALDAGIADGP